MTRTLCVLQLGCGESLVAAKDKCQGRMGGHQNPGLAVAVVCSSNMNRQARSLMFTTLKAPYVFKLFKLGRLDLKRDRRNWCRSMEAHARLSKKGFNVASFGTGDKVR